MIDHNLTPERVIAEAERDLFGRFTEIDETALYNQSKVIDAFRACKVAARHFGGTTGYGYDDIGRDTLCRLFAEVFRTEDAVVSPLIANGTHALTLALFGVLRPGDLLLSVTGDPYDTLSDVISGEGIGSLKDFGVRFDKVEMKGSSVDPDEVSRRMRAEKPSAVFIQRSRGYTQRSALSVESIGKVIGLVKSFGDIPVIVDNCYGEFTDTVEPSEAGADLVVGSLIKNPGGGIAPTGGYIAGKSRYISGVAGRLTAPGIGMEVGSYAPGYQYYYQGLFLAPHVVAQALKASALFSRAFSALGYKTLPAFGEKQNDIITSITFGSEQALVAFCQTIQENSPVDSFVSPEPWDMPGYSDRVIMAAGAFVQGASIEMSADAPIKEPYTAYFQGALTYEHAKVALKAILGKIPRK